MLNELAEICHESNRKFWFLPDGTPIVRNKGELMMLMVSEIAEAFDATRHDLMDDKLPSRHGAEVELGDAVIRILDYAAAFGYDLDGAIEEKLTYNRIRQDHVEEAERIAAAYIGGDDGR